METLFHIDLHGSCSTVLFHCKPTHPIFFFLTHTNIICYPRFKHFTSTAITSSFLMTSNATKNKPITAISAYLKFTMFPNSYYFHWYLWLDVFHLMFKLELSYWFQIMFHISGDLAHPFHFICTLNIFFLDYQKCHNVRTCIFRSIILLFMHVEQK